MLNRSDITSAIAAYIVDNTTREITPEVLRNAFGVLTSNGWIPAEDGYPGQFLQITGGSLTGALILSEDPTSNYEAATKQYVDNLFQGKAFKEPCIGVIVDADYVTMGNQLSGYNFSTADNVYVVQNSRMLVNMNSNQQLNGIYVALGSTWQRASDANTGQLLIGAVTLIEKGTTWGDSLMICANDNTIDLGNDATTFVKVGTGASYSAGNGIAINSSTISVNTSDLAATSTDMTTQTATNKFATPFSVAYFWSWLLTQVQEFQAKIQFDQGVNLSSFDYPTRTVGDLWRIGNSLKYRDNNGDRTLLTDLDKPTAGNGINISGTSVAVAVANTGQAQGASATSVVMTPNNVGTWWAYVKGLVQTFSAKITFSAGLNIANYTPGSLSAGDVYNANGKIKYQDTSNATRTLLTDQDANSAGYGIAINSNVISLSASASTFSGSTLNFNNQYQSISTSGGTTAISITAISNYGLGKWVRLEINSVNAGDSFSFGIGGWTVNYPGNNFIPGVTNIVWIEQVNTSEIDIIILPLV